jgi:protein-disulfide isomerase
MSATIAGSHIRNSLGVGKIAIIEFSDFQCPYCSTYAAETLPAVKRQLVDTGRIRYIAMQFPLEKLHPLALDASKAVECASGYGKYWPMHDKMFGGTSIERDDLIRYAADVGLDRAIFVRCLGLRETESKVQSDQAEGDRLGVNGTPSFLLGFVRPDGGIDVARRIAGIASVEILTREVAALETAASARTAKTSL